MPEATPSPEASIGKLIFVPSIITLAITILRLVGELRHWTPILFNPAAGGGGALIGISWLPLVLGPYFALKLTGASQGPSSRGRAIGFAVLGLVVFFLGGFVGFAPKINFPGRQALAYAVMAAAAVIQLKGWPAFAKILVAYAYAARVPVVVIMFFAIRGNWGTHYDALPPEYNGPADLLGKYLLIGFLPQMIFWVVFTVIVGALLGSIVVAIARHRKAPVSTS